jgi:hypothetical protein
MSSLDLIRDRGDLVLLVSAAHDDHERIIRQRPL